MELTQMRVCLGRTGYWVGDAVALKSVNFSTIHRTRTRKS